MTVTPFQKARESGYSDEEIIEFLGARPDYQEKINRAREAGYGDEEIVDFLSNQPLPNKKEKGWAGNFIQGVASSAPVQSMLGAFKKFSWPLDVLRLVSTGEGLQGIDELEAIYEREGIPFDKEKYLRGVFEAAEAMPTQQLAEDLIKNYTGLDLSPQGALSKIARTTGEIASLSPRSLLEGGVKGAGRKIAASATGATLSEGLEEVGVPSIIAQPIGFGIAGAAQEVGKKVPARPPTREAAKARATAEEFKLPTYQGMEETKVPKRPIVSAEKQEALGKELSESSRKAIEKVVSDKLPIKRMIDKGYDFEKAYKITYKAADETAKSIKNPVNTIQFINYLKKEIKDIKESAPSLSKPDEVRLKILKDTLKDFTEKGKKKKVPILYGPKGEELPVALPKRTPKKVSVTQAIDQKRNWNENLKDLYKKTEFTGAQEEVRKTYSELGNKLYEALDFSAETTGQSDFKKVVEDLRFGDKVYSEMQKLNQIEGLIEDTFKDGIYNPKALNKVLKNKKTGAYLKRSLGKEAIQDLKDIAQYGEEAQAKIFDKLKTPDTVADYIKSMGPIQLGLFALGHKLGSVGLGIRLTKAGWDRLQGYLMVRPATRKAYVKWTEAAKTGSKQSMIGAAKKLSEAINEEFGSEEALISLAKEK